MKLQNRGDIVMEGTINFNGIPVSITGDHPVKYLILKELSFPKTSESPKIKFNITKTKITPSEGSLYSAYNVYIENKDTFYMTYPFPCSLRAHYIKPCYWDVDISCDAKLIPDTFLKKVVDFGFKIINWTYLTKIEQLAYSIINGIFEPFLLFFINGSRTLLHASSIEKDGNVVLITGGGGVGKTSTSVKLIWEDDWKFLSDDISLIGADGTCVFYPRYLMIYAYNVENDNRLFSRLMKERSHIDRLQWQFMKKVKGLKGVRRRVPAELLFGKDKISNLGNIQKVIYLTRAKSEVFQIREANAQELANRCTHIIAAEYYYYLRYIQALESVGYSFTTVEKIMKRNRNIYNNAFKSADCFEVYVPWAVSPRSLTDFIREKVLYND